MIDRTHDAASARRAVRMLGAAQAAAFAVTGITVTAGPLSLRELSGNRGGGGVLLAVFILAGGAGAVIAGRLMRALPARRCLAGSHLAYGAGGVVCAAAAATHSPHAIVAAVVPLGLGHGAALLGRSVAVGLHPPGERGRAVGRVLATGAGGALCGPALVAGLRRLAEATGADVHALPWLAVPVIGALGALAVALIPDDAAPPHPGPSRGGPRGAVAGRRTAIVAAAATQAAMLALMSVVPVHIHDHGSGDVTMALVLGVHLASMYGLAPLLGAVIDRWGHAAGLVAGAAALSGGGALLSAVTRVPLVAAAGLVGLGSGWCASYLAATAAAGLAADARRRASRLATVDLSASAAAAGAGVATGMLADAVGIAAMTLTVASVMAALLAAACHAHRRAGRLASSAITASGAARYGSPTGAPRGTPAVPSPQTGYGGHAAPREEDFDGG